jgi:hypothetical protein
VDELNACMRRSSTGASVTNVARALISSSGILVHPTHPREGGPGLQKLRGKFPEEFTAIDEAISTTGKYAIAFGQHFRPTICYDVIGVNRVTGEAIRRHYHDHKDEAMTYWQEFKKGMTAKRGESEESEHDAYKTHRPN